MTDRTARAAALAAALLLAPLGALAKDGVLVSGSAFVDYWGVLDETVAARSPDSVKIDAAVKIGIDVHDDLAFSVKACVSCHGIEMEHASIDWTPSSKFNLQAGRLVVPFGEYSQRLDPSGHKTASAPLIYDMGNMAYGERSALNLGVVPQPYTDTGVLVYGSVWFGERIQAWYGVYGVSGFKGSNDLDWIAMRSIYYQDNNRDPAGGARLVLSYSSEPGAFIGDVSIGASGTAGRYDKAADLGYLIWGADASLRIGPFTVRGEYATRRTDLNPSANGYPYALVDDWFTKEGWYAELEHPLGKYLSAVYRYDELHRSGAPLPGSQADLTPDSTVVRYTAGLVVTPAQNVFAKLSYERWEPTDFPAFDSFHAGIGGAF